MKKSLDITMAHVDQSKVDEMLAEIPDVIHPDVWGEQFIKVPSAIVTLSVSGESGTFQADTFKSNCAVRFNDNVSRSVVKTNILAIAEIIAGCEVGTRIMEHDCTHDGTGGPCVVIEAWEVVL